MGLDFGKIGENIKEGAEKLKDTVGDAVEDGIEKVKDIFDGDDDKKEEESK